MLDFYIIFNDIFRWILDLHKFIAQSTAAKSQAAVRRLSTPSSITCTDEQVKKLYCTWKWYQSPDRTEWHLTNNYEQNAVSESKYNGLNIVHNHRKTYNGLNIVYNHRQTYNGLNIVYNDRQLSTNLAALRNERKVNRAVGTLKNFVAEIEDTEKKIKELHLRSSIKPLGSVSRLNASRTNTKRSKVSFNL